MNFKTILTILESNPVKSQIRAKTKYVSIRKEQSCYLIPLEVVQKKTKQNKTFLNSF